MCTGTEANSVNKPFLSTVFVPETDSLCLSNLEAKMVPLAEPTSFKFVNSEVVPPGATDIVPDNYESFLADSITESGIGMYFSFFTFFILPSTASGRACHSYKLTVPKSLFKSENVYAIVGFSFYILSSSCFNFFSLLSFLLSSILSSI